MGDKRHKITTLDCSVTDAKRLARVCVGERIEAVQGSGDGWLAALDTPRLDVPGDVDGQTLLDAALAPLIEEAQIVVTDER